jgi:uncharacterized protein YciI
MRGISMEGLYVVTSSAGPRRDLTTGTREQPFWDEHAAFIDGLVDDGFVVLGGPLVDEGGAMIVVRAESEEAVRQRLQEDPWYREEILRLERIRRWEIFVDALHP